MASASVDIGTRLKALLSPHRFVLSIGDEAVVLTLVERGRVAEAWVASPDPADGGPDILAALATRRRAPLSILMDAFELLFREEKVPRVGMLDQKRVVRRHLQMAFPGNAMRGALSHGTDPAGNQYYLFCAVPPTEQVKGWMTLLREAGRPPAGIHMLPLESLEMLRRLTPETAKVGGVRWRMLFTFDMAGGLRQIVAKQNRIVLTRLTPPPPPDSDVDPGTIIRRDFAQTLAYVKRMGYREGDNLDLVVLAEDPLASELREETWDVHSVTVLSPHDAGRVLGLGTAGRPGQPYADVLHALWFATRPKPSLDLQWSAQGRTDYGKIAARALPAAALAAAFGLAGWTGWHAWLTFETRSLARAQEVALDEARMALAGEMERLNALPYKAAELRPVMAVVDQLTRDDVPPVALFARLNHALAGGSVISELSVTSAKEPTDRRRRPNAPARPAYTIAITVELPPDTGGDADAVGRANDLQENLASVFGGGFTVRMTRAPVAFRADEVLRGGVDKSASSGGSGRTQYSVTYEIAPVPVDAGKGAS